MSDASGAPCLTFFVRQHDPRIYMIARARVLIDGEAVDAYEVTGVDQSVLGTLHEIEVQIAASVLLHELQESDVDVSDTTLRDFVATDSQDARVREAYLSIARAIASHSSGGQRRPVVPRWVWQETEDVQSRDGMITLVGNAERRRHEKAEPKRGANGRQPLRSRSMRESLAAASRRSRLALGHIRASWIIRKHFRN